MAGWKWTGRECRSQTFPYPCASTFITPGLTVGATGRSTCRRAECGRASRWTGGSTTSQFVDSFTTLYMPKVRLDVQDVNIFGESPWYHFC